MPAQTVNSAYQETEELKILTEEIGKIFTINYSQTPINPHIKYRPHNFVMSNSILNFMSI